MALSQEQIAKCRAWATAPSRHWQILNRAKWKYQFRGSAIVRYVEEVKMDEDMVRDMLAYLTSDDCLQDLETYNQGLTPENAYKPTKAWYEIGNKAAGGVRSVRLYHALTADPEENVDGPYLVEDGCAYKVSLEYHWNETSVPDVQKSTSGVSYRITNISHDQETDRYSYVIETRERIQQDIAEYLMSQTVYSKDSEEVHLGVKQDNVASTGQQVSVGGGKRVERKLSKNADCTSDIHNRVIEELPVSDAVVKVDKTLEGIIRTTKNKSQAEPAPLTPDKPGSSVTNEKTPGGLYDQTIVEADETPLGVKGEGCGKTIFEHSHSTTENVPDRPTIDAPTASGGVVEKQSASMTRYGTWDVHKTVETELPVADASVSVSKSLRAVRKVHTDRNQPEPLSMDGLEIGESRRSDKTQGGLYNNTVEQVDKTDVGNIGSDCAKTIFSHSDTSRENVAERPDGEAEDASDGVVTRKSIRETEFGTFDVTTSTETELPVQKSMRTVRMTLSGEYIREECRNQPEPLPESGLKIGESVTNSKTPGGLYNTSHEIPSTKGVGVISERCHQDKFTHHHTQVENKGADAEDEAEQPFEDGVIVDKAVSVQSNGTKDVMTSTTTPKPWIQRYNWASGDSRHYVVKYGNQPNEFANVFVPTDADSVQKNDHINAFNLHDGQIVWSYGPWRTKAGDLKFIKYGKQQKFYRTWVKPHDRRRYHVEHTIQMVFIRGDAYTDYLSDFIEADANRTQVGVLAVKLLDKYNDKDGNLLAEWIRLQGSVGAAKVCTSDCKHGNIDDNAAEAAIARILSAFEGMSAARTSSDNTASALVGIGEAIVASGNFGNTYAFNKEDGWSDGLGFEISNARKK